MENSKLLIVVPSKRRGKIFFDNVYSWLQFVKFDWVVSLEQEDERAQEYAFLPREKIITLPESNRGLGYAKVQLKKYAEKHGYNFVFKVDDDVNGWTTFRKKNKGQAAADEFEALVFDCLGKFANPEVAVISFPYAFQMFESFDFKPTKRVQTAYIARSTFFHANEGISVCEDFAMGLNAIVRGQWVLWYGISGIQLGVKVGGGQGGLQSFNRKERMLAEIEHLREIYPPLAFRKVDKVWGYEPDLRSVKIGKYLK